MGKELRESRLLAPSGRGRVFTLFLTHKFTLLSTYITNAFRHPDKLCGCLGIPICPVIPAEYEYLTSAFAVAASQVLEPNPLPLQTVNSIFWFLAIVRPRPAIQGCLKRLVQVLYRQTRGIRFGDGAGI